MKISKKLLTILLCAVMVLGTVAVGGDGFAEVLDAFSVKASATSSGTCGANLTWNLSNDGVLTISGTGAMTDYYGYSTKVPWYSSRSLIKTIVVNNGVTKISGHAFTYCENLISVTIPNSVIGIGQGAFYGCDMIRSAGPIGSDCDYEFGWINEIPSYAFWDCTCLTSIIIPESITSIGKGIIEGTAYYNNEKNWENNSLYLGNHLLRVKDVFEDYKIKNGTNCIAGSAFVGCESLKSITIPNTVKCIGDDAFNYCTSLTSVTIPDSVISIGNSAFRNCYDLTSVNKGKSVKTIGDNAFCGCNSLISITIPDNVTSIGEGAFESCDSLTNVIIPNSVKSIGEGAFLECNSLTNISVDINNNYYSSDKDGILFNKDKTVIVQYPAGKEMTNYSIPDNVKKIGDYAFSFCMNLMSVTIPESVTSIGYAAFSYCVGLTNLVIPNSVISIGEWAFCFCVSLTSATIPDNVTTIDDGTFDGCESLEYIHIPASVINIGDIFYKDLFGYSVESTYICSDTLNCKAKTFADENGIEFKLCNGHNEKNIYNLGEETYSFDNYVDLDSPNGHCFGMAVTSSGYYTNNLSKSIIGGLNSDPLYSFTESDIVKAPICHYFHIQGPGAEYKSIVAGGNIDLNKKIDTESDWNSCVNYVKNHNFDNDGTLNIGMWFAGCTGHAVNFLYYRKVDGQDRIYAYDNNYPDYEIYYYLDSDGYIHQSAESLLYDIETDIIGLDLMDVNNYFQLASEFDTKRYIYADKNEIAVEDAKMYYMKCGKDLSDYVMYEISENATEVTVIPLTDNASFVYMDRRYAFGEIDPETYGIIKVPTNDPSVINPDSIFTIKNAPFGDYTADNLVNVATAKTFDYRSIVTITATATDVPEGYHLALYVNGAKVKDGDNKSVSYTYGEIKSDINYTVKIVDSNGIVQKDSSGNDLSMDSKVTVNAGFFKKLVAFFKGLFKTLPKVDVKP